MHRYGNYTPWWLVSLQFSQNSTKTFWVQETPLRGCFSNLQVMQIHLWQGYEFMFYNFRKISSSQEFWMKKCLPSGRSNVNQSARGIYCPLPFLSLACTTEGEIEVHVYGQSQSCFRIELYNMTKWNEILMGRVHI